MFDFQKLDVYKKAKKFNSTVFKLLKENKFDRVTQDQLRRASFSIMLNIAEGSSRFTIPDKKNFLVIARGSVCECASIMEYLKETEQYTPSDLDVWIGDLEELSKMLFGLIRKLESK